MIYTMTLNPSVDYIVKLDEFQIGSLNKIEEDAKFPGGKGINVSQVLQQFGIESVAIGFIGGFTGKYIVDSLKEKEITVDFVQVKEDTRINIKLKTGQETEINGQGPNISEQELSMLMQKIDQLQKDDVLVLAGSIPKSVPASIYESIAKICADKGIKVVVDASGEVLLKVLEHKPFLIKPNHHELGDFFDVTIETVEDAIPYGKKLVEMGAQNVIVSLAGKGALLFNEELAVYANVPKGTVKNSVGAGDSVVGGFLASYVQTDDVKEAFKNGVASGSATAFSLELCTKEEVEKLLPEIRLSNV